jgi:hypothetical protein
VTVPSGGKQIGGTPLKKKLVHLALAAALMASSAAGAATLIPTNAVEAEQPYLTITYLLDVVPVGSVQLFCKGPKIRTGNTADYLTKIFTSYFMCP